MISFLFNAFVVYAFCSQLGIFLGVGLYIAIFLFVRFVMWVYERVTEYNPVYPRNAQPRPRSRLDWDT